MFIESSSGLLQENIGHTLEDTLKLLVELIKHTITHSKMNLKEDRLWKFVELRSADIPTNWSDRFNWVKMFELIATLFLCLKEEERVDMELKKENSGLIVVPKEETLCCFFELF
ncbi:hypothetical protein BD770DRAFT_444646 [Pilaira anomala]|nr:hypothetical protein BD770DRAFT_444646 [Pilaira anomala]